MPAWLTAKYPEEPFDLLQTGRRKKGERPFAVPKFQTLPLTSIGAIWGCGFLAAHATPRRGTCPFRVAGSTNRRNTCAKFSSWSFKSQSLSRTLIQAQRYFVQI